MCYRDEEASDFGEGERDAGVRLGRRRVRRDLDVKIVAQVPVARLVRVPTLLLLEEPLPFNVKRVIQFEKSTRPLFVYRTLCLSRMEPRPKMAIFVSVSSCSRFRELPLGPSSLPTKLNCAR